MTIYFNIEWYFPRVPFKNKYTGVAIYVLLIGIHGIFWRHLKYASLSLLLLTIYSERVLIRKLFVLFNKLKMTYQAKNRIKLWEFSCNDLLRHSKYIFSKKNIGHFISNFRDEIPYKITVCHWLFNSLVLSFAQ